MPFFGRPHLVTHPGGHVSAGVAPAHVAASILLLHYLRRADGAPPAGEWLAFRELPDGMFYAASFAPRVEAPLAQTFGAAAPVGSEGGLERFRAAAAAAGGLPLDLADAAFDFQAFPRLERSADHHPGLRQLRGVCPLLKERIRDLSPP